MFVGPSESFGAASGTWDHYLSSDFWDYYLSWDFIIFIPIITNPLLLCLDGQPDWVGDISLLRYTKQLVWSELRGLGFSLKEELERGWWSHIICIISAVEGRWSGNINCLGKSWPGDCVQVRVESIVEICVWLPDFLQHLHVEAQLVDHKVVRVLLQPLQALSDFQRLSDLLSLTVS